MAESNKNPRPPDAVLYCSGEWLKLRPDCACLENTQENSEYNDEYTSKSDVAYSYSYLSELTDRASSPNAYCQEPVIDTYNTQRKIGMRFTS